MGIARAAARPRVKAWAQRESESEQELSSASASEDDEYRLSGAPRKGTDVAIATVRAARSRSVRSSGNLSTPADLFNSPSSPSTVASTVTSPLLHDDKPISPFAALSVKNIKSFLKAGIPLLDARLVNRKAYNTDRVSWWPTDVRFVDYVLLNKQDQALVCEAMLSAVSLQDLERFAMVSCAVLSKDALPVVQELLQAAREAKQLLYTPESPVSPVALKIDLKSLPVKPIIKRSRSTASLDDGPPPAKSIRLSPSLIPLPIAASPLSLIGEPLVESTTSGVEISLLQAEEKITSRGRQFQLRPGFAPGTASCLDMGSLANRRRQEQLQNQLQNQSVGRHRQFSHHPLSLASQPLPIPIVPSPPLHVDNSLGLATLDNDIYSSTSDSTSQPFPPQLRWEDFQHTGPLPLGSFVTPSINTATYDDYIPGNFEIDIPQQATPAGTPFLGWLEC